MPMIEKNEFLRYAAIFESLTPESLPELCKLVSPDIHFKDPFQEVRGVDAFRHIFADMFARLTAPRFEVQSVATTSINTAFIRWDFTFQMNKNSRPQLIKGVSEILLNAQGLVSEHIDFWDAAENVYEKIPVIGSILRVMKRQFQAPQKLHSSNGHDK